MKPYALLSPEERKEEYARLQKEFPDWKQDGESLPPDAR